MAAAAVAVGRLCAMASVLGRDEPARGYRRTAKALRSPALTSPPLTRGCREVGAAIGLT